MNTLLLTIAFAQLALWVSALFLFFFQRGNSFAEAASYGIVCTLMAFSFFFQIAILTGTPFVSLFFEALASAAAVRGLFKLRGNLRRAWEVVRFVFERHPVAVAALSLVFGYLGYLACGAPPAPCEQCGLERMALLGKNGALFASQGLPGGPALQPLNSAVLSHLFLRADTRLGTGLIGFMAYLSIGFSTYALSRRYAWPPTAFTVTLITLSFPRLVFLSTAPGTEIAPAAATLFCILAIYRSLERPALRDLLLLILGIAFCISGNTMCLAFPSILASLACVLFLRRHGATTWTTLLKKNWKIAAASLVPFFVFSQAWLFAFNIARFGGWLGPEVPYAAGEEGNVLLGAVANMVRYFFQSIHLTAPVEVFCHRVLDISPSGALVKVYDLLFASLFGMNGAAEPFFIAWEPSRESSWFGPFGTLFVIPSIILAIFRGHRRLKAIALALAGYVYVTSLVVPWTSDNARYFTPVFACGGFCISFLLPPWRFSTAGKKLLQVVSILLLIYVCLFDANKPLFHIPESFGASWLRMASKDFQSPS